jgi:hypothetical protein
VRKLNLRQKGNLISLLVYFRKEISKEFKRVSTVTTKLLLLFKTIICVYYENYNPCIESVSGQNLELLNFKAGGMYSYHCVLKIKQQCCRRFYVTSSLVELQRSASFFGSLNHKASCEMLHVTILCPSYETNQDCLSPYSHLYCNENQGI